MINKWKYCQMYDYIFKSWWLEWGQARGKKDNKEESKDPRIVNKCLLSDNTENMIYIVDETELVILTKELNKNITINNII